MKNVSFLILEYNSLWVPFPMSRGHSQAIHALFFVPVCLCTCIDCTVGYYREWEVYPCLSTSSYACAIGRTVDGIYRPCSAVASCAEPLHWAAAHGETGNKIVFKPCRIPFICRWDHCAFAIQWTYLWTLIINLILPQRFHCLTTVSFNSFHIELLVLLGINFVLFILILNRRNQKQISFFQNWFFFQSWKIAPRRNGQVELLFHVHQPGVRPADFVTNLQNWFSLTLFLGRNRFIWPQHGSSTSV